MYTAGKGDSERVNKQSLTRRGAAVKAPDLFAARVRGHKHDIRQEDARARFTGRILPPERTRTTQHSASGF